MRGEFGKVSEPSVADVVAERQLQLLEDGEVGQVPQPGVVDFGIV